MSEASVYEMNMRVIKHELERSFIGHDEDGRCCLVARLTPTAATTPPTDTASAAGGGDHDV